MTLACRALCAGILLALGGCAAPQAAKNTAAKLEPLQVKFRYDSRTGFPDGTAGKGDVILSPRAGTYNVLWRADDIQSWTGIAQEADGLLGVTALRFPREYPKAGDLLGLAIYRVVGGELTGTKIEEGDRARHQSAESLSGPPSLNGRFEIAKAGPLTEPGYVKITPNGSAFLVSWINPPWSINGVGLRIGDFLFVGYSNRTLPSITVFCQAGSELKGLGTTAARPQLSFVTLTPKDAAPPVAIDSPCLKLLNAANPG